MTQTDRLKALRASLTKLEGARELLAEGEGVSSAMAANQDDHAAKFAKATEILQLATDARRAVVRERLESLVTRGLRAVFRGSMEFRFRPANRGGRYCLEPVVVELHEGEEKEVSILEGEGGGLADVVSFVLRVVILALARPRPARFLAFDEPFRHLGAEQSRGAATLVRELARTARCQFLIVTHNMALVDAADTVYRTSLGPDRLTRLELEDDATDELAHRAAGGQRVHRAVFGEPHATKAEADARVRPDSRGVKSKRRVPGTETQEESE